VAQGVKNVYWLGGEERCPHCLQRYAVAVERHCSACDGPTCPHCVTVVTESLELICPSCELEQPTEE
jgi:RecJ-like exonuclease